MCFFLRFLVLISRSLNVCLVVLQTVLLSLTHQSHGCLLSKLADQGVLCADVLAMRIPDVCKRLIQSSVSLLPRPHQHIQASRTAKAPLNLISNTVMRSGATSC